MLSNQLQQASLVVGVGVGMQQAHCKRRRTRVPGRLDRTHCLGLVQRQQHVAGVQDAFADLEAEPAWHQRFGALREPVVQLRPVLPADLEHITKALRHQQRANRAAAFEECVGGDRRTVGQERD
jgi:hypothetical protein